MNKVERRARFKRSLQYTWPFYLLGIVVPCVALPFAFNLYHRPKAFETISIFVSGKVNDISFQDKIKEELKDKGVRMVESISCDVKDPIYFEKLTKVAFSRCDIFLIPSSIAEHIHLDEVCVEMDETLLDTYFKDEETYKEDKYTSTFGIKYDLTSGYLNDYIDFSGDDMYLFVNGASKNIGKYNENYNSDNVNAFIASKMILG